MELDVSLHITGRYDSLVAQINVFPNWRPGFLAPGYHEARNLYSPIILSWNSTIPILV